MTLPVRLSGRLCGTFLSAALLCLGSLPSTRAADALLPRGENPRPASPEQMQWFRDAKFGLFLHWGPSSLSGKEISWGRMRDPKLGLKQEGGGGPELQKVPGDVYDNLYRQFNPVQYNADEWIRLAKAAGMKYAVLICKHHDGFSMWPTRQVRWKDVPGRPTHYSIADTPFAPRDPVREFVDACHRHGLKAGLYYSTRDWTHPDYLEGDNRAYNAYYQAQVKELISNYLPDILWFDHCFGNWSQYTIVDLFKMMYTLSPNLLVNDRAARGLDGIPAEWRTLCEGDFSTPENRMGTFQYGRAWESCMILSNHPDSGGWSYRPDAATRPLKEVIQLLCSGACGDGNVLLNLAPMPTGEFRPEELAVLRGLAPWMQKYGEAIHETRGGPWVNGLWGGATHRGDTVYLHVFQWTGEQLRLPALKEKITRAELLTASGPVAVEQTDAGVTVSLESRLQDPIVTLIKLKLSAAPAGPVGAPGAGK